MKRSLFLFCFLISVTASRSFAQAPNPRLEVNPNNIKTPTIMDLVARINKLEEENTKLKKELDDLKTSNSTLTNTIDIIKKDCSSQTAFMKGLDLKVTTLKTDLATLQGNFNTHYHKIKGGFSIASEDGYVMHFIRTAKTLHDDVETFKSTGGPIQ